MQPYFLGPPNPQKPLLPALGADRISSQAVGRGRQLRGLCCWLLSCAERWERERVSCVGCQGLSGEGTLREGQGWRNLANSASPLLLSEAALGRGGHAGRE